MFSPAEFYQSLPPISKAYGTICVLVTTACSLGLIDVRNIALVHTLVFSHFQVWRLITNLFFLGKFSVNFGIHLLMLARYGVQLEKGTLERGTAEFLWMMIFGALTLTVLSAIPIFWSPFLGISLVFVLVYVWSREFPTANVNLYGLVQLEEFYLPWAMIVLDVIFGSPVMPYLLGVIAGHLYYFLTVLHCIHWQAERTYYKLRDGFHRHKVVARWRIGAPPPSSRTQPAAGAAAGTAFRGRSYRLNE